ncbi:hypothetical protein AB0J74_17555 [Asanoa sp. NPDC049573]|uniref:hypothetical protein n=1 Tax=Asanoa sp. NPDC049573 TaxID=3155396 RepID=UPI0034190FD3
MAATAIVLTPSGGGRTTDNDGNDPARTFKQWAERLRQTLATQRAESWRVVCDGVVQDIGPADPLLPFPPLREADLDAALTGARGTIDRSLALDAVNTATVGNQNRMKGPPGCCGAAGSPARDPMPTRPTTAPRS